MILSVMVISHNQAHLIKRCLDSILRQCISAPWEIVISDDASTDSTWEIIQDYATKYTESKKDGAWYQPIIRAYQINSSDYKPTVTSDRCAANKANVYMHARGKYCVNIDADDYLLGNDIYEYQINQLEDHPECSVSVQNIWYQNDGESLEQGHPWHYKEVWQENEVIDIVDYCKQRLCISNPAFVMRRDTNLNPLDRYGLLFDDPIISTHHIIQGKIICTQKAQYVYVQYGNSIWNQVGKTTDDMLLRILSGLIIYLRYFPNFKHLFLEVEIYNWIKTLKKLLLKHSPLQMSLLTKKYIDRLDNFGINKIIYLNKFYIFILLCVSWIISKTDQYNGILAKMWYWIIKE